MPCFPAVSVVANLGRCMPPLVLSATTDAVLPALGNQRVGFKVFYSAALPDFATWRATRAGQGFDARTFEVRARPAAPIEGARPGMSVLVQ